MKKTVRVLCFITLDKPSFLGQALENTVQYSTLSSVNTIVDTWGKRCTQMIMFGDVPDIKVENITFRAVKSDNPGSWKALAEVLIQVTLYCLLTSALLSLMNLAV